MLDTHELNCRTMPRLRSARCYFLALILLSAACLAFWRVRVSTVAHTVTLSDGRQLIIRQLTYGTEHKFVSGSILAQFLGPVLPPKWQNKIGLRKFIQRTEAPTLMIWGEWRLPRNAGEPASMCVIEDENSSESVSIAGAWMGVAPRTGLIMGWTINNFPRRTDSLHFKISEWNKTNYQLHAVASFTLPNPARRDYPVWNASSYPITQHSNGVDFSMANLVQGPFIAEPWLTTLRRARLTTGYTALFQIKANGLPQEHWKVENMTALDATGNLVRSPLQPSVSVGDYMILGLNGTLWPAERTWKFTTRFIRTGDFRSNELCRIQGIEVPFSPGPTQILVSAQANGVSIIGIEFQGYPGGSMVFRRHQDIELQPLLPRDYRDRVVSLAEVRDDRGRKLEIDRSYHNLEELRFGIQLLPGSRSLDLTFAVQVPVTAEFLASPTQRASLLPGATPPRPSNQSKRE